MSTYILVHGAWAGGWCWDKVVPLLKQAGHQVETLDLPGHGQDRTPIREITLAAYVKRFVIGLSPHHFRKRCIRRRHVKKYSQWGPAMRLSYQHPRS